VTDLHLLVTCEHAGNRVPEPYRSLFRHQDALLNSHRGWDPGALRLARHLARVTGAPLRFTTVTRLLADANRSPGHGTVFSELTRDLPEEERRRLLTRYHRPYRSRVIRTIRKWLDGGVGVLHLSVHSFAPVLDGVSRTVDVGVLYDPDRDEEAALAGAFVEELERCLSHLRIGRNVPYHGTADGLTTALRRLLDDPRYLGIELEVSQALTSGPEPARDRTVQGVGEALATVLERWAAGSRSPLEA
jgi:predicted N-formylglutamate amidohydrolase